MECKNLLWLDVSENHMKTVDVSPLFYCSDFERFLIDETVPLKAHVELTDEDWPRAFDSIKERIFWVKQ